MSIIIKSIGKGIFQRVPEPKNKAFEGIPNIHLPPEITKIIVLQILIVPKVTIIGARCSLLTRIPLNNPNIAPTIAPTVRAKMGSIPEVDNLAIVKALNPKIEPAETSIPPVIIINVIPIALIAILDVCIKIFLMFENCKKDVEYKLMKKDKIKIVQRTMNSRVLMILLIFSTNNSPLQYYIFANTGFN